MTSLNIYMEGIKEIETSLDWPDVESQIRNLAKTAPEFKFDVVKFCSGMRGEISKLSQIELKYRQQRRDSVLQQHKDQCAKINRAIKDFSSVHLMHLFSRVDLIHYTLGTNIVLDLCCTHSVDLERQQGENNGKTN